MDENVVEIHTYTDSGFKPLVHFKDWRVAVLNYFDGMHPDNNKSMERHTETDEVFVLVKGRGILLLGGNGPQVNRVLPQEMEIGTLYNVRRDAWHTLLLSRDGSVLIVEQGDTGERNSEFAPLTAEFHRQLVEIARIRSIPD